jgi:hypothetical protein
MPASKLNYIVVYNNHSQVYGCSNPKIALESSPPEGLTEEDKNIFFVTFEPDSNNICLYKYSDSHSELGGYDIDDKPEKTKRAVKKEA